MKTVNPLKALTDLKDALGITYPVRRITIDVDAHKAPTIVVESYVKDTFSGELTHLLKREYELIYKSDSETPVVVVPADQG